MTTEDERAARPGRVSIREVAWAAGVAVATVSRALNDQPNVSEETRRRIQEVAARLGYRQNAFARGLVQGQAPLVGVVANAFHPFNGEYFAHLLHGLAGEAKRQGLELLLSFPTEDDDIRTRCETLYRRGIAAGVLVISPGERDAEGLRAVATLGFAVVVVNPLTLLPDVTSIALANAAGAHEATQHLLALGHRRIGILTYLMQHSAGRDRLAGYTEALRQAGCEPDARYIASETPVRETVARWMAMEQPPTALLCFNDSTAYATIHELAFRGVGVPGGVSVVGFGDLPTIAQGGPRLTTVHQPVVHLGERAMQLLIAQLAREIEPGHSECLDTHLVVRDTTKEIESRQSISFHNHVL